MNQPSVPHQQRVCLITDVASEIGRATVHELAHRGSGYLIVGLYRGDEPPGISSQIERPFDPFEPEAPAEPSIHAIKADVNDPATVSRVVELLRARHRYVDLVVHTASHARPMNLLLAASNASEALRAHMRVNVDFVLDLTLEIARTFWRDRAGENARRGTRVVCLRADGGGVLHSTSMGALAKLTQHLHAELAAVRVGVDLIHRKTTPQETARAIACGRPRERGLPSDSAVKPHA